MEAILKILVSLAMLAAHIYSLCFIIARLWLWSAVEALHLPPLGLAHVYPIVVAVGVLRVDVRGAIEDTKEDWSKNAGEGVIRLFAIWLSLGLCWLVRWWLAP